MGERVRMELCEEARKLRKPVAGKQTIANLLLTALQPVGNTMYVWGGGWNEEDDGAGYETRRIGVSPQWKQFADEQDADYDFKKTRYQIHDGLDCSGYVGWVIYNVFEDCSGRAGYVMPASYMAWEFAGMGWGRYTPAEQVRDWKAGDIMSAKGHVWIALGMCEDGSVLLLHASPPGVTLCGTPGGSQTLPGASAGLPGAKPRAACPAGAYASYPRPGEKSMAELLAEQYMSKYYSGWYERYPECSRDVAYLKKSAQMRWNRATLCDKEGLTEKNAEEILSWLFGEHK